MDIKFSGQAEEIVSYKKLYDDWFELEHDPVIHRMVAEYIKKIADEALGASHEVEVQTVQDG